MEAKCIYTRERAIYHAPGTPLQTQIEGIPQPLGKTEEWKKVIGIAKSWLKTPYRHRWMRKGRGADCTLFLGAIFLEAGILTRIERPLYYSKDWHIHTTEELVLESLVDHLRRNLAPGYSALVEYNPDPKIVEKGDLLGFQTKRSQCTNHAAMYVDEDNQMINSINGRGVVLTEFGRPWTDQLTTLFRVLKWV